MKPDDVPNLTDPTRRPDEPPTAGLPFGPGPGPRGPAGNPLLEELRAMYSANPYEDLRELIEDIEREQGGGF
jgi:hypothetical protein